MANLDLAVILSLVDKVTGPAKRVNAVTGRMVENLRDSQKAVKELGRLSKSIQHFEGLNEKLGGTSTKLAEANRQVKYFKRQMEIAGKSGAGAFSRDLDRAKSSVLKLTKSQRALQERVTESSRKLKAAGVDTRNLAKAKALLANKIGALNKKLQVQATKLALVRKGMNSLKRAGAGLKKLAIWGGIPAAVGGAALGINLLKTAESFERYEAILKALEGSEDKAKEAMDWVSEFAKNTPLQLEGVVDAYTKLKSFRLDPKATLQPMVDMNAKLGGNQEKLEGIILAVGQAWTKQKLQAEEAMQLIERGVPVWDLLAEKTGKTGAELMGMATAGQLGRKHIQMLIDAMGQDAAGAATDQMKTWGGMVSNLGDAWTRFQKLIMDSGPFERVKELLAGVLDKIDAMAASGALQAWAERVGERILQVIDALVSGAKQAYAFAQEIRDAAARVAEFVGGWDRLALIILAMNFAPIIAAIAAVGVALTTLATMALAHPVILLLAGLAAGAVLIIKNWDKIKAAIAPVLDEWARMGSAIKERWNQLMAWFGGLPERFVAFGKAIIDGLGRGIDQAWVSVKTKFQSMLDWLPDIVRKQLDLQSPSKVFAGFGRDIMLGLGQGMAAQENAVMARVERVTEKIKQAGAGMAPGATSARPAATSHLGVRATAGPNMRFSGSPVARTGKAVIEGAGRGLGRAWASVKSRVQTLLGGLPNIVREQMGQAAPLRLFAGFGRDIMLGLGQGMAAQERPLLDRAGRIAARLKRAGAGMALSAAVALPVTAGATPGARQDAAAIGTALAASRTPTANIAPLAASPAPAKAGTTHYTAGPISITVNGVPGMDELKVAELVAQKLEQAQRQQITRARSRLFDDN